MDQLIEDMSPPHQMEWSKSDREMVWEVWFSGFTPVAFEKIIKSQSPENITLGFMKNMYVMMTARGESAIVITFKEHNPNGDIECEIMAVPKKYAFVVQHVKDVILLRYTRVKWINDTSKGEYDSRSHFSGPLEVVSIFARDVIYDCVITRRMRAHYNPGVMRYIFYHPTPTNQLSNAPWRGRPVWENFTRETQQSLGIVGVAYLPTDVSLLLAKSHPKLILSLALTDRIFAALARNDNAWRYMYERDYPRDFEWCRGRVPVIMMASQLFSEEQLAKFRKERGKESDAEWDETDSGLPWKRLYMHTRFFYNALRKKGMPVRHATYDSSVPPGDKFVPDRNVHAADYFIDVCLSTLARPRAVDDDEPDTNSAIYMHFPPNHREYAFTSQQRKTFEYALLTESSRTLRVCPAFRGLEDDDDRRMQVTAAFMRFFDAMASKFRMPYFLFNDPGEHEGVAASIHDGDRITSSFVALRMKTPQTMSIKAYANEFVADDIYDMNVFTDLMLASDVFETAITGRMADARNALRSYIDELIHDMVNYAICPRVGIKDPDVTSHGKLILCHICGSAASNGAAVCWDDQKEHAYCGEKCALVGRRV
jgi:hypothetical protein